MAAYKRRIYFIEKKFQRQFILKFCLLVILGSLVTVSLLYLFSSRTTTVSFENTEAVVKSTADFIFPLLIQTVVVVTVLVAIFSIMLTLFISHKIAGPLYRFKRELEIIKEGDLSSDFRIRENDQLKDLAEVMNATKEKLRRDISFLKSKIGELDSQISKLNFDNKNEVCDKIGQLKSALDYFRT